MSTPALPLAYTIRACAAAVQCSERTIRRAIASGRLHSVRIGRAVRIPSWSLAQFLSSDLEAQGDTPSRSLETAEVREDAEVRQ